MLDRKPAYIALFPYANNQVAGTGFTIREGLLITCAHVVRDALGLGPLTPVDPPSQPITVRFPHHDDKADYKAVVMPDGWFPGSSSDISIGPLRDIAVLTPARGERPFPPGKSFVPDEWQGEAICYGFPSKREGILARKIHGHIDETVGIDDWLNFVPLERDANTQSVIVGMSGSPLTPQGLASFGGMLPANFRDDKLIIRVIPGEVLNKAVAKALSISLATPALRELAKLDRLAQIQQETMEGWQAAAEASSLPAPEVVLRSSTELLEAARLKANHLPESFPFRYLERRLAKLEKLTKQNWPPEAEKTGEFVVDLAEFITLLTSLPNDLSETIDACGLTGQALGRILENIEQSGDALYRKISDAPWPSRAAAKVREHAEGVIETAKPLQNEQSYRASAETIEEHAGTILDETYRNPPHWTRMAGSVSEIGKASQTLKSLGAFPDISASASALKQALCQASDAAIAALQPFQRFKELRFAPEMIIVPAGTFMMGSPEDEVERDDDEGPQHRVTIPKPFAVGRYPVTNTEWAVFCEETGRSKPDIAPERNRHPVANVSWDDAKAYIDWLNGYIGGGHYRLLSEAEWEYCCRARTQTRYSFGDEFREDRANNGGGTTEVGSYPANDFGLYDMHGNVWEWCEDVWHESYDGAPDDGSAWLSGSQSGLRVRRGGSWSDYPRDLRSAYRFRISSDYRLDDIGFRLSRTLNP